MEADSLMAVNLVKGQKTDLTKGNPNLSKILVGLGWDVKKYDGGYDFDLDASAFLVGVNGKVRRDEDFVFYGNLRHKSGAVEHSGDNTTGGSGDLEQIRIDLGRVPNDVEKIAFTATIYDAQSRRQNFGMVRDAYIRVVDESSEQELLRFELGNNFAVETAIVVGELYRHKGNWKFNAIGAGFSGGLAALCNNFGVEVSEDDASDRRAEPAPPPPKPVQSKKQSGPLNLGRPNSNPPPAPNSASRSESAPPPKKIELRKGQKIDLRKKGSEYGEIVINLNWSQPAPRQPSGIFDRIFGSSNKGIDLDLGCLFELKNGEKGAIQALGNNFGSLNSEPYIALDGDDRTGSIAGGETIRVNGKFADKIKRILVYTFIYDGVANWREADGVVTVKCSGSPDIIVRMDEYGSDKMLCGIALIENTGSTFSVEKVVEFFDSQRYLDQAFNWGLRWGYGRK